jgi:hypothetical protein
MFPECYIQLVLHSNMWKHTENILFWQLHKLLWSSTLKLFMSKKILVSFVRNIQV